MKKLARARAIQCEKKTSTESVGGQQLSLWARERMMKTRGKSLRQPGEDPGIVMIEGQQFRFQLEGVWRSDIAPQPGQVVEVYLDRELQVIGISVVTEAQESNQSGPKTLPGELSESGTTTGILGKLYAKLLGRDRQHAP